MAGRTLSRVLVIGLGRSGVAAARLAARDGAEVWVTDLRVERELSSALAELPRKTRRFLGGHPTPCLDGVDLVVVSPGVSPASEILETARRRGVEICSEVEFAWRHADDRPLVAVTGSNGKSTVTVLVAEMLKKTGMAAVAGGNLGTAACELVLSGGWQCWVLEVSSFQAELLTALRPDVGVFLNLSPDHLERHPDIQGYLDAKRRLFAFQKEADVAVLNADDPSVAETPTTARRLFFSLERPADGWLEGDRLMLGDTTVGVRDRIALGGMHNLANGLAAALAARAAGADPEAISHVLEGFAGLSHRHLTVHDAAGVKWVDDSKATNVGATLAALRGYPNGSVHVILGGQGKGQDFSVLVAELRRAAARVYLIGIDGPVIAAAIDEPDLVEDCGTIEEAVQRARKEAVNGQWVLLAPACASFDQFEGFADRGTRFATLAREEVVPCP
jgi:UDP-N-acetylmuramoylalanine--D-glutamate ligase